MAGLVVIGRMRQRLQLAVDESDALYFHELLYLGELATKLTVLSILASTPEDKERNRYRIEAELAKADGLGSWLQALEELLTGPVSAGLPTALADIRSALINSFKSTAGTWQSVANQELVEVCAAFGHREGSAERQSLKGWFQALVWLRNKTRAHGAPMPGQLGDVARVLSSAVQSVVDNLGLFKLEWAYIRQNQSGKYRVVDLGNGVSSFTYLKSTNNDVLEEGVYLWADGPRKVPLLYSDPDITDFFVANGAFRENTGFECLSYSTGESRDFDAGPYLLPVTSLPLSGTRAGPILDLMGECFTNIPEQSQDYVSRPELEGLLQERLLDDRHPVVTMLGRGGVGKTSIAISVARKIAILGEFFSIVWFSARDIDLLPQGPKQVQPDVLTLKEMARQFSSLMNPLGSSSKTFDHVAYFNSCLSGHSDVGPFLFIFDNFETVRSPVELFNQLNTFVRLPNKILITSRSRDFNGDFSIQIGGMSRPEFDQLVDVAAHRLGIRTLLADPYLDDLYDESDGHPYIVKVLLGEVEALGRTASLQRVMASRDDILNALFERTWLSLAPAPRRAFLTLCGWRSMVPLVALQAALLRPANDRIDVDGAVETLIRTSLVELVAGQDGSDGLIRVPLAAHAFGKRKLVTSPIRTLVEADSEILQLMGAVGPRDTSSGIEPRVHRMVKAIAVRIADGHPMSEEVAVVELIAARFSPAWLLLADLMEELPDRETGLARSSECLRRYLEQDPQDAPTWRRLADVCGRQKDQLGDLQARLSLSELPASTLTDLTQAANRFNQVVAEQPALFGTDDKTYMAQRIRVLLERRKAELRATDLSRLAWICLHLGDQVSAVRYTSDGLSLEPDNVYCQRLANKVGALPV
jgi:hypothetical protein